MFLDDIAFRNLLGKGEDIQYVARQHFFMRYGVLFKVLLFGVGFPLGGLFLFPPFYPVWVVWIALGIFIFVYEALKWFLDAWIITNMGVVDQEWRSYFDKGTTRIEYQSIAGISTEIKGFWGAILGYGDIRIEHVSSSPIVLSNVARPRKVERMLMLAHESRLRNLNFTDQSKLKDLLTNLLRTNLK